MGENSEVIMNMPSNFLSGYGAVTSQETRTTTLDCVRCVQSSSPAWSYLVLPIFTSTRPYSSPNVSSMPLYSSEVRPSRRTFCRSALRMNSRSFVDSSASRGMVAMYDSCYATMLWSRKNRKRKAKGDGDGMFLDPSLAQRHFSWNASRSWGPYSQHLQLLLPLPLFFKASMTTAHRPTFDPVCT